MTRQYSPAIFANPVTPPRDRMAVLNGSVEELALHLHYEIDPPSRFVLMHLMANALRSFDGIQGLETEVEDLTRMVRSATR